MTQEELKEADVRLPNGREERFGDFTQEDLELCAEFQRKRAEARGGR